MPGALSKLHSALEVVLSGTDERWLIIKNAVFLIVVIRLLNAVVGDMYRHGVARVLREYRTALLKTIFAYGKRIPAIQSLVKKEVGKVAKDIEHSVAPKDDAHVATTRLPAKGVAMATIKAEVDRLSVNPKVKVDAGRVSGAVYWGGKDVTALSTYVYEKFAWSNPLHPDVFPGLRRMDAEIVAMVVNMYNGGTEGCGTTTSGGTESILLAMKTYRDWALETKGVREPELIVPATAHAAFDKAAGYFGIKLYHADVDKVTGRVKLADVRRLVNRNTIAIAGSAPGFPHGIIDDIEGLAAIARKNNIGLHVDCCLGGFIVPFMEKAGFPLPRFDFRVKGVTSISCDTHKYGFAPKGSSVIMYANRELRRFQYFVAEDWTGGIYASPTIAGSRPGALLAGCWATLMFMGEEGYVNTTRAIVQASRRLIAGLRAIDGLFVYGEPLASVVAWGSNKFDIYRMSTELTKRGWNLSSLQFPASIHLSLTYLHTVDGANGTDPIEDLLKDCREIVAELMKDPHKAVEGSGAMYGMAATVPDRSIVGDIARTFVDAMYIVS